MTLNPRIKMSTKIRVITIIQEEVKEEKSVVNNKFVLIGRIAQLR